MILGQSWLRGDLWRRLTFWGMSWFRATFSPSISTKQSRVFLVPWQNRGTYACAKCHTVVVLARR